MAKLSKEDKNTLEKAWKAAQSKDYILAEENVQELFEYLEEQLDNSYCNHTLHHTEQWLKDNISLQILDSFPTIFFINFIIQNIHRRIADIR